MSTLTDRINALETDSNVGLMINKDAVLEIVKDAIAFEIEPHGDRRELLDDEGSLLTFATLDTALRVLAVGAAKASLMALRESIGVENVLTDEEIVAQIAEQLGHPASLAHAAVVKVEAGRHLMEAYELVLAATADRIVETMGEEDGE